MPNSDLYSESKTFLSTWFRSWDIKSAGSDEQKLKEIGELSDEQILRKWFWVITIVGFPACYIALPLLLGIFSLLFSSLIMQVLWFVAKLAMGMVLIIFGVAVYLTWRTNGNGQ